MKKTPYIFAVSGQKNSGKTTLIEKLVAALNRRGYQAAVIKHDGHDFEADVPGTDSYRHFHAGVCGTAVFSSEKVSIVKRQKDIQAEDLFSLFPEADFIILEGFKGSSYPKLAVVRAGAADGSQTTQEEFLVAVGCSEPVIAVVTDVPELLVQGGQTNEHRVLNWNDTEAVLKCVFEYFCLKF